MRKAGLIALLVFAAAIARGEPLLPMAEGTTWRYESTEELGGPAPPPPTAFTISVTVGRQNFGGKDYLKFQTVTDDAVTKTELMTLDDHGLVCHLRAGKDGRMARLDPPQTLVPAGIKVGDSWESDGEVAGMEVHQHFKVAADDLIRVPAGNFRALHIHSEDVSVMSVALDRWFVPGMGLIKETTVVRGPTGGLLQRTNLELQKRPEVIAPASRTPSPAAATPEPRATSPPKNEAAAPGKRLVVDVSPDPNGGTKTEFKSTVENIYVRWHGHGLPEGARVRVAWIAEDVGDLVEPNFIVDETESVAPAPDASAKFTLGRPPDGWAEGKYRVEFYVNDELEETIRVTIVK
jgi:hypothetical protein